jgi:hypothetical protein
VLVNEVFNKEEVIARVNKNYKNAVVLELPKDPQSFARKMYAEFRKQSEQDVDLLILPLNKQTSSDWDAINNRLKKAASWDLRK